MIISFTILKSLELISQNIYDSLNIFNIQLKYIRENYKQKHTFQEIKKK
jgi:hypothetical protein